MNADDNAVLLIGSAGTRLPFGYIGEVRLFPVTDTDSTLVLWTSRWDSSGGGVAEFCDPVYRALLMDLKKTFA